MTSPHPPTPAAPPPMAAVGQILLVEPFRAGVSCLRDYLQAVGYRVHRACGANEAARHLRGGGVETCVMDGELGVQAVLDLCSHLAGETAAIVLAPSHAGDLGIRALDAGADDYLAAPANARELLARIRAVNRTRQRRTQPAARRIAEALVLHPSGRIARGDGRWANLTPTQHRLLEILASRAGEVVSRCELLDLVFGQHSDTRDRLIDVHVSRLRRRLGDVGAADLVSCYRGIGYRFGPPRSAALGNPFGPGGGARAGLVHQPASQDLKP